MSQIYLDHNATSPMETKVMEGLLEFIKLNQAHNPSSIHSHGRKARSILEESRKIIAQSISTRPENLRIIFLSSGTEANNMLVNSYLTHEFFVSNTEHVSILECPHPKKIIIEADKDGTINPELLNKLLKNYSGKKIVSIMLANNETGVINKIKSLSAITHQHGGLFHCDASQAFGKIELDFNHLDVDFMTISSHKSGGPTGAAALIAKNDIELIPLLRGGKQEIGLRAGTENLTSIYGFALAAQEINNRIANFQTIEILRNFLEQEIKAECPDASFIGSEAERLPNTSCIRMPGIKSEEQLIKFDLAGISVSAGSACSSGRIAISHVLDAMKIEREVANEVIRVSLGPKTHKQEIEKFIALWKEIYNKR